MADRIIRTRFAPSPTGYMHIGGLRTALYSYMYAKKNNGKFILRIEDTDRSRYVEGAEQVIYDTLRETGLMWDEGPLVGGEYGPYIQSQRKTGYLEYAKQLVEKGAAYYCFCSKERLESLPDENGARKYDKHCLSLPREEVERRLANGESYVIRQNVPASHGENTYIDLVFGKITIDNTEMEDQILIKSDGMPTYNFANVIDDHLMNITCVMRGAEYLTSTPKYNMLYDAFGWERPVYIHLPVIMKDATHKFSKRDNSARYSDLIEKGFLKEAVLNYIALLGWAPKDNREKMTMQEMTEAFDIAGISHSNSIFDENKLRWLNSEYIKELSEDKLVELASPYLEKSVAAGGRYDYTKIVRLAQTRVSVLSEIPELIAFLDDFGDYDTELFCNKKLKTDVALARRVLPEIARSLEKIDNWTEENIHKVLLDLVSALSLKNGQILWPARVAVSGKQSTPGGATEIGGILGKEETLRRIYFSINLIEKNTSL